jgi:hypothetical protein
MPPVLFSENIIAITMKFTCIIHTSFAVMRLFSHKVSVIFNALLPTSSKTLYSNEFPASTSEHITKNFVSVRCHLQNGVHVVLPVRARTGDSRRAPDLDCAQDGEQFVPF